MMESFKEFKYRFTYPNVSFIYETVFDRAEEEYLEDYFDPEDGAFRLRISKPQKDTLLHDFLRVRLKLDYEYFEDKVGYSEIIDEYEKILNTYHVPFLPSKEFEGSVNDDGLLKECEDTKFNYIQNLKQLLIPIFEQIVQESFTILFGDRMFLLKFNEIVASITKKMRKYDYPEIMKRDGVVKRATYIPRWLKDAIFHRDKGKCQVCGRDLSGLMFLGEEIHYDHVIPLNLGGNNDPTNFQLLCKEHNLSKSGTQIITSERYQTYW
ncbi:HNH endonuclease [Paenibacillus faecis]|uniref:HNH endonuclease n=1 Tax=Paenibacillus faecis TaxID=862114 RepID=A0A5D0CUD6_9BACL|nr:HNH endonuclease signature motif containing protein [Paenibacillus faecis]TYA13499.1 HNH endonuclease [Paenibacillus faecis]